MAKTRWVLFTNECFIWYATLSHVPIHHRPNWIRTGGGCGGGGHHFATARTTPRLPPEGKQITYGVCVFLFWRFIRNKSDKWYLIVIEKATRLKIEKYDGGVRLVEGLGAETCTISLLPELFPRTRHVAFFFSLAFKRTNGIVNLIGGVIYLPPIRQPNSCLQTT